MQESGLSLLASWENFYVIVGSSAGALTGLMFVVITLISGVPERRGSGSIAAFGTPTVVHFCVALLVAALLLPGNPNPALFIVGAATLLLLFIGIHNSWDAVTYIAVERYQEDNKNLDKK